MRVVLGSWAGEGGRSIDDGLKQEKRMRHAAKYKAAIVASELEYRHSVTARPGGLRFVFSLVFPKSVGAYSRHWPTARIRNR